MKVNNFKISERFTIYRSKLIVKIYSESAEVRLINRYHFLEESKKLLSSICHIYWCLSPTSLYLGPGLYL